MKRALVIAGALVLAGCSSIGQNGEPLPQITFDHVSPYPLYVASYEAVALPPENIPSAPVGFIANPGRIIMDYLNSRFESAGSQGKLLIKVKSVEIEHERINSENSFSAFIGLDKKDHYRVSATIDLDARGINDTEWQKQTMTVYRDIYISEHVSLVERENLELQAMDHMIDDLDIALRKVLNEKFHVLRPQQRQEKSADFYASPEQASF